MIEIVVSKAQEKQIQEWAKLSLQALRRCSVHQMADYLTLCHYARIYLIEQNLLPADILIAKDYHIQTISFYFNKLSEFAFAKLTDIGLADVYDCFSPSVDEVNALSVAIAPSVRKDMNIVFAANIWLMTLSIEILPDGVNFVKDIWSELKRGIPFVYARWHWFDASCFEYDFSQSDLFATMERDMATFPAILKWNEDGEQSKGIEEVRKSYENNIETYKYLVELLKCVQDDAICLIVAMTHHLRIFFVHCGFFPFELWDDADPKHFKLSQYIKTMEEYMSSVPSEGDSIINHIGAKVWYLTVLGLSRPGLYKPLVKEIWHELSRGLDGAYEVWKNNFDTNKYADEVTLPLIKNMAEDIKKIPAALR